MNRAEIQALIEAADARRTEPEVFGAYVTLKMLFEVSDETLKNQLAKGEISWSNYQDYLSSVDSAAKALQQVLNRSHSQPPADSNVSIHQSIGTVTGGNVTMIGQQTNATPSPTPSRERGSEQAQETSVEITVSKTHDLFMSYAREDKTILTRLCADLRAAGLSVWTDDNLVTGTPSWKKAIERAIKNACAVVVLLSPDAAESEWVERELDYARAQDIPIFPVIVRGSKKDAVPLSLINAQWVMLNSDDKYTGGLPKLIAALQQEVKSQK